MAEIQTLQDLYKRDGIDFIENLFNKYVVISEKINATRFCFIKDESNNFTFYKKDGKITLVERTLNKLFEAPISYIESLSDDVKKLIIPDYTYGFRYFHKNNPIFINYDKMPLNGLILTDIKNKNGRVIDDVHVLNKVSDFLLVEKPPILWCGKLTDDQKTKILDFIKLSDVKTFIKYNSSSFTKFIISILNPDIEKTSLNNNIDKPIDSIIFKFIDNEKRSVIHAKLVDPIMQTIKDSYEEDKEIKDMFGIILSDIVEFIGSVDIKKYSINKLLNDDRYLELIFKIYNDYIESNGYKFDGINLETPGFSNLPEFDLNMDFIFNETTKDFINKSDINKKIFKIIVSTFIKNKHKKTLTITDSLIHNIKLIKNKIVSRIDSMDEIHVLESNVGGLITFEEFINKK